MTMTNLELRQMGAQDAAAGEDTESIAESIRESMSPRAARQYRLGAGISQVTS